MSRISYYSTNRSGLEISFGEALLKGLSPDKGLFMPSFIPAITHGELRSFRDLSYREIAASVLGRLLEGEIDRGIIEDFCESAYDFDIPVEEIYASTYLLRLDGGPTASFKDFAARFMSRVFSYYLEKEDREVTILTATSGDTGSAVASAFYGMERIKVIILYPRDEVSELQRKQMTTLGENISVLAVDGKFDDCQALVKRAFSDSGLKDLGLSSANSINIGRLLPQAVYYFYAWSRVAARGEKVIFSVPSGNFGNLTGGLIAARIGLPVERFIASVNANDEFPLFLDKGFYRKVDPSRNCISSAMNVGHPSNLARIIELYGGNMDHNGIIRNMPDMERLRNDITSFSISDLQTRTIIKDIYNKHRVLIEPHGAVALGGLEAYRAKTSSELPAIVLETAHPAKFPDIVKECTGVYPVLPASLEGMDTKTEYFDEIVADYGAFFRYIQGMP